MAKEVNNPSIHFLIALMPAEFDSQQFLEILEGFDSLFGYREQA